MLGAGSPLSVVDGTRVSKQVKSMASCKYVKDGTKDMPSMDICPLTIIMACTYK